MREAVLPLSIAMTLALGVGTLALAGAADQSPSPAPRQATVQPAAFETQDQAVPYGTQDQAKTPKIPATTTETPGFERVWRAGDDIGKFNFHLLSATHRYKLPALPRGQAYVALGTQVLRVNTQNWKVLSSVGNVNAILG